MMNIKVKKRSRAVALLISTAILIQLILATPVMGEDRPEPPGKVYGVTDNRTGPTIKDTTYTVWKSRSDYTANKDPIDRDFDIERDELRPGRLLVIKITITDYSDQGSAGVGVDPNRVDGNIDSGGWKKLERIGSDEWQINFSSSVTGSFSVKFRAYDKLDNRGTLSAGSINVRKAKRDPTKAPVEQEKEDTGEPDPKWFNGMTREKHDDNWYFYVVANEAGGKRSSEQLSWDENQRLLKEEQSQRGYTARFWALYARTWYYWYAEGAFEPGTRVWKEKGTFWRSTHGGSGTDYGGDPVKWEAGGDFGGYYANYGSPEE